MLCPSLRPFVAAPVLAAVLALLAAPQAGAVTVDALSGGLRVVAAPGETNDLTVSLAAGTFTVTEAGSPVTVAAGLGCTPGAGRTVTCASTGLSRVTVELRDGNDAVTVTANVPATIDDGEGDDTVQGGPHGDTLVAAPGRDTLHGGAGIDLADYAARTTPVLVSLDGVAGDGAAGEGDDVGPTVDNVRGGAGADRLVGSDGANVLRGNGGDDVFDGRGGSDTFVGDTGQDAADYRARGVRVVVDTDGVADDGAAGENDNVGGDVDDLLGGAGSDLLVANDWWSTLDGGAGDDTLRAAGGGDTLLGGPGADTLEGGDGDDVLAGGAGDDDLRGGTGVDLVDYRERGGSVVVDLWEDVGGEGPERDTYDGINGALGGRAADQLLGGDGDERFDGGPGDDVLEGGGGGDRMAGGEGWDRADYGARRGGVTVWLNDGADDGSSGERDDVRRDVEEVTGGAGDDRIGGTDGPNVLSGGGGHDQLWGNGGDDDLQPGEGNDAAWGGGGRDTLRGASGNDRLGGDDGDDVIDGGDGGDTLEGGRDLDRLEGGSGGDKLHGHDGGDQLAGGEGGDDLHGGSGDDGLDSGAGNDSGSGDDGDDAIEAGSGDDDLGGGKGNDRVSGGDGGDQVDGDEGDDAVAGGAGDDRVRGGSGVDTVDGGDGADKAFGDDGADLVSGGGEDDELGGGGDGDRLDGGDGRDALAGGGGDDVLDGGPGPDRLRGEDGEDTADYGRRLGPLKVTDDDKADDGEPGEGDEVTSSTEHVIGGAGNDLLRMRGDAPHRLFGEHGNDVLDGGPKEDTLVGGAGKDQLIGRDGKDLFDGGAGNDRLSGTDRTGEQLRCGAGRDTAVRDRLDKAIACEILKRGTPSAAPTAPTSDDVVPIGAAPARRTGVRRVTGGGRFVSIPGSPGERIDVRLLRDVAYLKARYRIAVTDGFAMSGHARGGEHPRGLALDIVPGPGGSWSDIDRLARWAEPSRNRPRAPFRWVGYDGDPGHGRGHHLHLSWNHAGTAAGRPARWVETFSFKRRAPRARRLLLSSLAGRSNFRIGGHPSVRSGMRSLPRCQGPAQLRATWKAAGRAFGIRWSVLAAITEIESGHGCNMGPSSAGAIGWTQFMPGTWKMWGMDADGNGKASPYSSADAIFSSARYLRASGAPRSYRKALFAYNHATWYVNDVLRRAKKYR